MNILEIIKDANHNLLRSKLRTFLTILAIFVGSFTIILNTAINTGVNSFIDSQIESIGGDGYLEIAPAEMYDNLAELASGAVREYNPDRSTTESVYISQETLQKVRDLDGVETAEFYTSFTPEYITSSHTDKKYQLGVSVVPSQTINIDTVAGHNVDTKSSDYQILLSEDYVTALGFSDNAAAVNQTVEIAMLPSICSQSDQSALLSAITNSVGSSAASANCKISTIKATVVGVKAPSVMIGFGNLNVNPALYHALEKIAVQGLPKEQTEKSVSATVTVDPAKVGQVKTELEQLNLRAMTIDDQVGAIRTLFDAILIVFNIFGGIALLAASIGIVNTLFMSVQERTREIGLDKALGMSKAKIFLNFSTEAVMLGFWGSVFGILVSMLIGHFANELVHAPGGFLEAFPTFNLVEFSFGSILPIVLIIMLIAFIAGTAPARAASRKNPIDALRYE